MSWVDVKEPKVVKINREPSPLQRASIKRSWFRQATAQNLFFFTLTCVDADIAVLRPTGLAS